MDKLKTVFAVLALIVLLAYAGYTSWLYYAGTCLQIKNHPIPTQVPNRCIGAEL